MAKIKHAAALILSRGPDHDPEVFLARRAAEIKFFGDYWVFPGGNVSSIDYHSENDDLLLAFKRCVIRETLEEINILSASLGADFSKVQKRVLKQALLDRPQDWQAFLSNFGSQVEQIKPVFRITTPPFAAVLFDTQFMHLRAHEDERPQVDNYELVEGCYLKPRDAIQAWVEGKMNIAPPVLYLLRMIAQSGLSSFFEHAEVATQKLRDGHLHEIYFSPGIFMAPLATDTIPPATTTNTLIVGNQRLYIVDPATTDTSEQGRLFNKLDSLIQQGKQLEAILLTHHHRDHVGAVNALSQRYQLPVHAHELCYARIDEGYIRGQSLQDGDILDLGIAPDASRNWHLKVLHTPGHAVDHLCFLESRYQAAIVGDMLSTVSTILINPPEGHMRTYLDSLQRLLTYPIRTLYPAHGPAHRDGASLIRYFLQHRQARELATLKALNRKPQHIDEILPKIYEDADESVYPIAARSLLAQLIKLEEDGHCEQIEGLWTFRQHPEKGSLNQL